MATYAEVFGLISNTELRNKVVTATIVKAHAISQLASPSQKEIDWAARAYANPIGTAESILRAVLAANVGATVAQILGAADATIQTNVNDAVDKIFSLESSTGGT